MQRRSEVHLYWLERVAPVRIRLIDMPPYLDENLRGDEQEQHLIEYRVIVT